MQHSALLPVAGKHVQTAVLSTYPEQSSDALFSAG